MTSSVGLVAIPAFNEVARLGAVLDAIRSCGLPEDIVVIDDGSTDGTSDEARRRGIRVITHSRNRGYHEALRSALAAAASYPYLVLLDADGQHDPAHVARLRYRASAPDRPDVVIGSRFVTPTGYRTSFLRRLGMVSFEWLTWAAGARIRDTTSGFKLLSARVVRLLVDAPFGDLHAELIALCVARRLNVVEVSVEVAPGPGTSMYTLRDAIAYPLRTAIACVRLARWARAESRWDTSADEFAEQ